MSGDVVVIGVGNPFRRDDGVGAAVVERLRQLRAGALRLVVSDGEPTGLMEEWDGARLAVVVDAVAGIDAPGQVTRFEVDHASGSVPERAHRASSHALGIGDAVALARALDRLPGRLVVLGIGVVDLGEGPGLSPPVATAVDAVARDVLDEVTVEAS